MFRTAIRATILRRVAKTSAVQNATLNTQAVQPGLDKTYKLNNGLSIPAVAFVPSPFEKQHYKRIKRLINSGYRWLDISTHFHQTNLLEHTLWRAVDLPRDELFISAKISLKLFQKIDTQLYYTLRGLRTGYLDLLVLRWPGGLVDRHDDSKEMDKELVVDFLYAWRKMEEAHAAGKIKSLGVADFPKPALEHLLWQANIKPAVHYLPVNPYLTMTDWVEWNKENDIHVTAHYPHGYNDKEYGKDIDKMLADPLITDLTLKYSLKPEQIITAWHASRGESVVPFVYNDQEAFDHFRASASTLMPVDVKAINSLDRGHRVFIPKECTWGEYDEKEGLKWEKKEEPSETDANERSHNTITINTDITKQLKW